MAWTSYSSSDSRLSSKYFRSPSLLGVLCWVYADNLELQNRTFLKLACLKVTCLQLSVSIWYLSFCSRDAGWERMNYRIGCWAICTCMYHVDAAFLQLGENLGARLDLIFNLSSVVWHSPPRKLRALMVILKVVPQSQRKPLQIPQHKKLPRYYVVESFCRVIPNPCRTY